jgi:hypothetical protein
MAALVTTLKTSRTPRKHWLVNASTLKSPLPQTDHGVSLGPQTSTLDALDVQLLDVGGSAVRCHLRPQAQPGTTSAQPKTRDYPVPRCGIALSRPAQPNPPSRKTNTSACCRQLVQSVSGVKIEIRKPPRATPGPYPGNPSVNPRTPPIPLQTLA